MGVDDADLLCVVLFPRAHAGNALAAAALGPVGGFGDALDVAKMGEGHHHIVRRDQVFHVDLTVDGGELRAPLVREFIPDGGHFVLDDGHQLDLVGQKALQVGDVLFDLVVFRLELIGLQVGEPGQAHVEDGLGLLVRKAEVHHQGVLGGGGILAVADGVDHRVDIVQRL